MACLCRDHDCPSRLTCLRYIFNDKSNEPFEVEIFPREGDKCSFYKVASIPAPMVVQPAPLPAKVPAKTPVDTALRDNPFLDAVKKHFERQRRKTDNEEDGA